MTDMLSEAKLQSLLDAACEKYDAPGAALAIAKGDDLVAVSSGVLNSRDKAPVLKHSLFQIGSVSKVVTATLVMCLVDEGRIELDAPVTTYLSDFTLADHAAAQSVTIRQLLCHTNGIAGDFMSDTGCGEGRLERYLDRCALLPMAHPVGDGFSYSNAAYCIAGRVCEVVTGLSFDEALQRYLFGPLGLENTVSDLTLVPGRSVSAGHLPDAEGNWDPLDTIYTLPPSGAPAGATILMSSSDLAAFARMHLRGGVADDGTQILSAELCTAMQNTEVTVPYPSRDISRWGLGWFLLDSDGGELVGHDGATIGQSAYLRLHPETDSVAVLFANGGSANDMMIDVFAEAFEPIAGVRLKPAPASSGNPPDNLEMYVGEYSSLAFRHRITLEGGKLYKQTSTKLNEFETDDPPVEIIHVEGDTFMWGGGPPSYPVVGTFLNFDDDDIPQSFFTGLRTNNRP